MLHSDQVGANEGNVVDLLEHANNAGVVDTRDQDRKQVREQCGLLLQVERQALVVTVLRGQRYSRSSG